MEIIEILKSKIAKDEIPSFMIFEGIEKESTDDSIKALLSNSSKNQILNSPDVLVIRPHEGKYTVDDGCLEEIYKFSLHRPLELKSKWVFWTEAELITDVMSNKLLKLLEEPPAFLKIVFFIPAQIGLLKTIQSRAIKIKFSSKKVSMEKNDQSNFIHLNAADKFSKSREFNETEETLLITHLVNETHSYKKAHELLQSIKKIEKHRAFHQNQTHKLYQYLML